MALIGRDVRADSKEVDLAQQRKLTPFTIVRRLVTALL